MALALCSSRPLARPFGCVLSFKRSCVCVSFLAFFSYSSGIISSSSGASSFLNIVESVAAGAFLSLSLSLSLSQRREEKTVVARRRQLRESRLSRKRTYSPAPSVFSVRQYSAYPPCCCCVSLLSCLRVVASESGRVEVTNCRCPPLLPRTVSLLASDQLFETSFSYLPQQCA